MPDNVLTDLIPDFYHAFDRVARERTGFIRSVARDAKFERVAIGQPVLVPLTPTAVLGNNTPGMTAPDVGAQTITNVPVEITKSKNAPIQWNGEQTLGMSNAGTFDEVLQQQIMQAIRALSNAIEADLASTHVSASRANGLAGTAPFGTAGDLSDVAGAMEILEENGAPDSDLHLVLGTAAMANIRGKQSTLFKVNEAGSDELIKRGTIGMLEGFELHTSGQILRHTKGTGAAYQSDLVAGYDIGSTTIHLEAGTGTILAGDVVTFAGDNHKYVVTTGFAGDGDGDIVIAAPGLQQALANDTVMTIGDSHTANMAFDRSAIVLAARLPAKPKGGDSAADSIEIQDPNTGLVYEAATYKGYLQNVILLRLAWGWKVVKPEFVVKVQG